MSLLNNQVGSNRNSTKLTRCVWRIIQLSSLEMTRKISRDFPGFQVFRLIHHVSCAFPCIPRIFHAMDIPMTTMPFFFTIIIFDSWTLPQWYVLCDYFCSQRKIWWQALCCLHYSNGSSIMNAFKFSRKVSFQSFKRLSKRQSSTEMWP